MGKTLFYTGCGLFFFLIVFFSGSVSAGDELLIPRVTEKFEPQQPAFWEKESGAGPYSHTTPEKVQVKMYSAYNDKYLYIGFQITDSYLTFKDDYSVDFRQSDHLRLFFRFPERDKGNKGEMTLYLLPTSKIKEPLINISGLSWRRTAFQAYSLIGKGEYFSASVISLEELGLKPEPGQKFKFNCQIYDVGRDGSVNKHWLFGDSPDEAVTLVFK